MERISRFKWTCYRCGWPDHFTTVERQITRQSAYRRVWAVRGYMRIEQHEEYDAPLEARCGRCGAHFSPADLEQFLLGMVEEPQEEGGEEERCQ